MTAYEVNFDGLVGLTHHYAGLSFGNEAVDSPPFSGIKSSPGGEAGIVKDESVGGCRIPSGRNPTA
ncbi:succinylarginine dihydrolase [Salmonella bongori]|nr:succinylarginine dihydrolase [Salmonella bongori]